MRCPLFCDSLSFSSSLGLSAWIQAAGPSRWGRTDNRRKSIIRTHRQQELSVGIGSDYIGLVLVTGIEPVRGCPHGILSPRRLPIPPHQREPYPYYPKSRPLSTRRLLLSAFIVCLQAVGLLKHANRMKKRLRITFVFVPHPHRISNHLHRIMSKRVRFGAFLRGVSSRHDKLCAQNPPC